jgi:hypothetical protein
MRVERQQQQRQEATLDAVDEKVRRLLSSKDAKILELSQQLKISEKSRIQTEAMIRDLNKGLFTKDR